MKKLLILFVYLLHFPSWPMYDDEMRGLNEEVYLPNFNVLVHLLSPNDPIADITRMDVDQKAIFEDSELLKVPAMIKRSIIHFQRNEKIKGSSWLIASLIRTTQDIDCFKDPNVKNAPEFILAQMDPYRMQLTTDEERLCEQKALKLLAKRSVRYLPSPSWLASHGSGSSHYQAQLKDQSEWYAIRKRILQEYKYNFS